MVFVGAAELHEFGASLNGQGTVDGVVECWLETVSEQGVAFNVVAKVLVVFEEIDVRCAYAQRLVLRVVFERI